MTPIRIGPHILPGRVLLAPMAGITDQPFRQLCRRFGAALTVSEMVAADPRLRDSAKTRQRVDFAGDEAPRVVQLVGNDPRQLAEAARHHEALGAQIIDLNMGCPAKKVCHKAAGSALLRDEALVAHILEAVVEAVAVPVTLKIRTGWDPGQRNGVRIAHLAELAGIQALAVHGRTRACGFAGSAEYDTIAAIKAAVCIPVIANGDITTAQQAQRVLDHTHADGVMIGRAALGRPWIFGAMQHYLDTGHPAPEPSLEEIGAVALEHLAQLHGFYGEHRGVRVARKHLGWYLRGLPGAAEARALINQAHSAAGQMERTADYFTQVRALRNLAA